MSRVQPPCRSPALPLEVIENAIEYLRGEYGALLNVALAHRALYHRVQQVLYAFIKIKSKEAIRTLARLRRDSPAYGDNLARVEELTLYIDQSVVRDTSILSSFAFSFAGVPLPLLHTLELKGMGVDMGGRCIDLLCLSKTFSAVQVLRLIQVAFPTPRYFVRFVCALPQLRELFADVLWFRFESLSSPRSIVVTQATGAKLRLRAFSCSADTRPSLLPWLIRTPCAREGTLLEFQTDMGATAIRDYEETLEDINNALRCFGSALHHLDVAYLPHDRSLDLQHCSSLEVLSLGFDVHIGRMLLPFVGGEMHQGGAYRTLASLNDLVAKSLRTLVMELDVDYIEPEGLQDDDIVLCENIDWAPFNNLIADPRFSGLQSVDLLINFTLWRPEGLTNKEVEEADSRMGRIRDHIYQALNAVLWHRSGLMKTRYDIQYESRNARVPAKSYRQHPSSPSDEEDESSVLSSDSRLCFLQDEEDI